MKKIRGTMPGGTHVTGPGGLSAPSFARWYVKELTAQWKALDLKAVSKIAAALEEAERHGRQVFVIGNGGSAASASHISTDFCKTAAVKGGPLLKCISLTDNVPYMTAIGNDLSFGEIFTRQLENLLRPKDVLILISGSGNSENLLSAARFAKSRGSTTIAMLGFDGGRLKSLTDIVLHVPSDQYGIIEDIHMGVGHILAFFLKQRRSHPN